MGKCTLKQTTEAFIAHLKELGKKDRTLYTYRRDLDIVEGFFGSDKLLADIRVPQVGKFFKSDVLLKLPSVPFRGFPIALLTHKANMKASP